MFGPSQQAYLFGIKGRDQVHFVLHRQQVSHSFLISCASEVKDQNFDVTHGLIEELFGGDGPPGGRVWRGELLKQMRVVVFLHVLVLEGNRGVELYFRLPINTNNGRRKFEILLL